MYVRPGNLGRLGRRGMGHLSAAVRRQFAALGYYTSSGAYFPDTTSSSSPTNWSGVLTTGINDAASVAKVAVGPVPTQSVLLPSGALVTASGGAALPISASSLTTTSLLESPLLLLGIGAIVLVMVLKR